jgi:cupin fold WbuC family metalloprotein
MRTKAVSREVLYPDEAVVKVAGAELAVLKAGALANERRRMRLCAHRSPQDALHEMLIALGRDTYIRPHKHGGKSESFHVIEGQADVVFFDDAGGVTGAIALGERGSGRYFYYRLADPWYHCVLVNSPVFVFHETTNGPFDPEQTTFAPWAPLEDDLPDQTAFVARLRAMVGVYRTSR